MLRRKRLCWEGDESGSAGRHPDSAKSQRSGPVMASPGASDGHATEGTLRLEMNYCPIHDCCAAQAWAESHRGSSGRQLEESVK